MQDSQQNRPSTNKIEDWIPFQSNLPLDESAPQSLNPAPWFTQYTSAIANPILRMHNETIDFAEFVLPNEEQQNGKEILFSEIQNRITQTITSTYIIAPFLTSGVYLKGTQLEVFAVLEGTEMDSLNLLTRKMKDKFEGSVKLVKEEKNGENYHIEGTSGNTKFTIWFYKGAQWKDYLREMESIFKQTPEIKYLFLVYQCMSRQRDFQRQIKSVAVFALCDIFFFQRRKQRTRTLAENILKFLQYYGMGTLQQRRIVYTSNKGKNRYDLTAEGQPSFSFVVGKNQFSGNIFKDFFAVLKNRYRLISNFSFPNGNSILVYLVNPSLNEFGYL